eukprot:UN21521
MRKRKNNEHHRMELAETIRGILGEDMGQCLSDIKIMDNPNPNKK